MPRKRRRQVYYSATTQRDGTILGAYPTRKPSKEKLRIFQSAIDDDGVYEMSGNYSTSFASNFEGRFRFLDIVANRLNARRAVREIALPELKAIRQDMADLREQVDRVIQLLSRRPAQ